MNGDVTADSIAGDVTAHTVNGDVDLATTGFAEGHSVNGSVRAVLGRADWSGDLEFTSGNGGVTVVLPGNAAADVSASTVNGGIDTDFPLTVSGKIASHSVTGTIGKGGRRVRVATVTGDVPLQELPSVTQSAVTTTVTPPAPPAPPRGTPRPRPQTP